MCRAMSSPKGSLAVINFLIVIYRIMKSFSYLEFRVRRFLRCTASIKRGIDQIVKDWPIFYRIHKYIIIIFVDNQIMVIYTVPEVVRTGALLLCCVMFLGREEFPCIN